MNVSDYLAVKGVMVAVSKSLINKYQNVAILEYYMHRDRPFGLMMES